jgi:branched-chain amino acid transport system ATP-binding protein
MEGEMTSLVLENVNTFYGKRQVLREVSFKVGNDEIVTMLGRNGAGKTTTLRSIMGLVRTTSGKIEFKGTNLTSMAPHEIPRTGIAYVPQGRGIFSDLTVHENLLVGALGTGHSSDSIEMALDLFPILKERIEQTAGTLSGGEQQMLAIGRALASNPKLLLMDEPTEGLMPSMVQTVLDVTKRINSSGVGVLIVEQRLEVALKLAHQVIVMENGSIRHQGPPRDLVQDKDLVLEHLGIKTRSRPD